MSAPDDLITVAEAAKLHPSRKPGHRLHRSAVYRWINQGKLRAWERDGGLLFVSRREVLAMLRLRPAPAAVRSRGELLDEAAGTDRVLREAGIRR